MTYVYRFKYGRYRDRYFIISVDHFIKWKNIFYSKEKNYQSTDGNINLVFLFTY